MKKKFTFIMAASMFLFANMQNANAQQWKLNGNNDATSTSKLGTKNNVNLRMVTGNNVRMTIDTFGYVGIGTPNPLGFLHVSRPNIAFDADGITEIIRSESTFDQGFNSLYEHGIYRGYWGSYAGKAEDMDFGTGVTNLTGSVHLTIAASPKVTVDSIGRVGIGTVYPFRKLQLQNGDLRITNDAGTSRYFEFVNTKPGYNDWRFEHYTGGSGNLYLSYSVNDFGSFTDLAKFDTGYYKFTVYGNAIASGGLWIDSDSKLKKNIKDVPNAMDIINRLKPHSYNFKADEYKTLGFNNDKQFGFVAQELETVLPELVHSSKQTVRTDSKGTRVEEDIKSVNYIQLIPVLTKALQEQDEKIQKLEALVEKLTQTSSDAAVTNKISLSNVLLDQNTPNPVNNQTSVSYNLPGSFSNAQLVIADSKGKTIKQFQITQAGKGIITIDASMLIAGNYYYSLIVDGKNMGSKQMIVAH